VAFLRFLSCCTRFLEHWIHVRTLVSGYRTTTTKTSSSAIAERSRCRLSVLAEI